MIYFNHGKGRTYRKKGETKMTTWYTVNYGASTLEETFETYEGAEMMALALAATTGEFWNVEKVIGWDR